jgi:Tat protein translocase TatC
MARSLGEMPFLDHLEELRSRILKALAALIVGVGLGIWLVDRFKLIDIIKAPITPLLPTGRLVVQGPTEPIMILLKLGFVTGLVLASPVIVWQIWAFLSPALYAKEKKAVIPSLFAGLILFLTGSILSFVYVVPRALQVLLGFQAGSFENLITFEKYYDFVLQVVLAMGLSAELPMVIILLAMLGVVTPKMLGRFRRYAIVLSFAAGAVLSPGTDVFTMLLMTAPLILLYEVGYIGTVVVHRRRLRAAARAATMGLLLLLALAPSRAEAQRPPVQRAPPGRQAVDTLVDSLRNRPIDSASARRLGLPTAPSLSFPAADSIINALLDLDGFETTRYRADTAQVNAVSRGIKLEGHAMTERAGSTLEAGIITYREGDCRFEAERGPQLFQEGTVVVGSGVKYDTCIQRGLVQNGLTSFPQGGANWYLRGNIAMDSSSSRVYASAREVTSCDLPEAHYHFSARELKWISGSVMVARPAVLYIRDVPIAWIPFLFQDTKRGRRSGILTPQFGFNDIVRPSRGYNRTIQNIGYYWAPNDYLDVLARFDWFSNRYIEFGLEGQYRWINQNMRGAVSYSKSKQIGAGGGTNTRIVWNNSWTRNNTTRINWNVDYSTNSQIIRNNSIDPRLVTQDIRSSGTISKQYRWGNLSIGGNRSQSVTDGSGRQTLPSVTLSPKPIDLGSAFTWSPDLSFTIENAFKQARPSLLIPRDDGTIDTVKVTGSNRAARFNLNTPLRIGGFNWTNSMTYIDSSSVGARQETVRVPDESTADPTDSVTVRRLSNSGFGGGFNWNTSINLPILFRNSWKVTPSLGITNTTSGDFAVRSARTDGQWVTQGKRFQFGLSMAPTFYGFFGGIGPLARIRHTIQPSLSYAYAPSATVPLAYAKAVTSPGQTPRLRSDPTQTVTLTLNQNFEAKTRRPPGDTTDANVKKLRLLSIQTSSVGYDFEQAKLPGRSGWTTSTLTNTLLSDLVPGFNFSITHDLWKGVAGSDTATLSPFLAGVTASFSLSGRTFASLGKLLGLGNGNTTPDAGPAAQPGTGYPNPFGPNQGLRRGTGFTSAQNYTRGGQGFNMSVNYTLSRTRPSVVTPNPKSQSNIALNSSFSPTRFWQVNWTTQYNGSEHRFESQQLNLTRDLHDWRATFSFTRSPNGNFAFSFLIMLIDLPDLRFPYQQSTIQPQ